MNMIVEVIDGVAYVAEKADTYRETCKKCTLAKCNGRCENSYNVPTYYRLLTAEERVELQKAIGRGM